MIGMAKQSGRIARVLAGVGAALLVAAAPAGAQQVTASNPASVVAALQAAGYKAALTKDKAGDPKIESAAAGAKFYVLFYGCEKNKDCQSLQLLAGYTLKTKPTIQKMNEWNGNNRFSSAFIDGDGDPDISFDVVLAGDGMSQALFGETITRWTDAMAAFQSFIGW